VCGNLHVDSHRLWAVFVGIVFVEGEDQVSGRKQEGNAGSHEGEADDGATGGFPSGY
jgi:hypothetical protein